MSKDASPSLIDDIRTNPFPFLGIFLGNLIPLYGVLFWGWDLFSIFYLYWIQNVVIGIFTLARILLAGARANVFGLMGALFKAAFFTVHYGIFCMGHGMIMTEIFFAEQLAVFNIELTNTTLFLIPWLSGIEGFVWALAGIIIVEVIYNLKAVYDDRVKERRADYIMFAPYGRIVVLHLAIILGGMLSTYIGLPVAALAFLVALKILYDALLFSNVEIKAKLKNRE